jgi:threonine aldolase
LSNAATRREGVGRVAVSDFRSDTVTKPDAGMRRAMYEAEVGDDVYGEDPTVRRLEEESARVLGLEATVFVPSGTMANQAAVLAQTRPGDEAIVEAEAHILYYERAGMAALSGVQARTVAGVRGVPPLEAVAQSVRGEDLHFPTTRLLCLENTHNRAGGAVVPPEAWDALVAFARTRGVRVHLDGARIWNAAVALGVAPARLTRGADTVSACFSKGLGAPVGSVVGGSAETAARLRQVRKLLGGGMRQAGILAAAALYALEHNRDRLAEDHANARRLAEGLAQTPGLGVDVAAVETNIVLVRLGEASVDAFLEALRAEGVLATRMDDHTARFVTHLDVGPADVERALGAAARARAAVGAR